MNGQQGTSIACGVMAAAAALKAERILISPGADPQASGPREVVKAEGVCSEL